MQVTIHFSEIDLSATSGKRPYLLALLGGMDVQDAERAIAAAEQRGETSVTCSAPAEPAAAPTVEAVDPVDATTAEPNVGGDDLDAALGDEPAPAANGEDDSPVDEDALIQALREWAVQLNTEKGQGAGGQAVRDLLEPWGGALSKVPRTQENLKAIRDRFRKAGGQI